MTARDDSDDYRTLFLSDTPMMDMRAPLEFARGAFPCATSLPLMSDEERAQVGTCYKQQGQQAAIELGHQLVSGATRAQRLQAWCEFARRHPDGYLYCFRGGLRSQTVQQWLRAEGIDFPLVKGGYKAMRRFLIDELERSVEAARCILVSGKTGTGKTRVIQGLARSVDLEGLAHHRGSSFGQLPDPQPSQVDFENSLSIALMKLLAASQAPVFLEDEGRLIGRLYLPEVLREKMARAPMAVVEESLGSRVDVVLEDYIIDLGRRYHQRYGDEGHDLHAQKMLSDLGRIRKRLGGSRYREISQQMDAAFTTQRVCGDVNAHRDWIARLLEQYYDPMYEYQLGQRRGVVQCRGDRTAVLAWAAAV